MPVVTPKLDVPSHMLLYDYPVRGVAASAATAVVGSRHWRGSKNIHVTSTKGEVSAGIAKGVSATFNAACVITVNTVATAA
jgi:hypothetical protein